MSKKRPKPQEFLVSIRVNPLERKTKGGNSSEWTEKQIASIVNGLLNAPDVPGHKYRITDVIEVRVTVGDEPTKDSMHPEGL